MYVAKTRINRKTKTEVRAYLKTRRTKYSNSNIVTIYNAFPFTLHLLIIITINNEIKIESFLFIDILIKKQV